MSSSKRGRKRNDDLPPNRARDVQRAFRARRAVHLQALEQRVAELEEENTYFRKTLGLPPANRPPLGKGPTGKDKARRVTTGSPSSDTLDSPRSHRSSRSSSVIHHEHSPPRPMTLLDDNPNIWDNSALHDAPMVGNEANAVASTSSLGYTLPPVPIPLPSRKHEYDSYSSPPSSSEPSGACNFFGRPESGYLRHSDPPVTNRFDEAGFPGQMHLQNTGEPPRQHYTFASHPHHQPHQPPTHNFVGQTHHQHHHAPIPSHSLHQHQGRQQVQSHSPTPAQAPHHQMVPSHSQPFSRGASLRSDSHQAPTPSSHCRPDYTELSTSPRGHVEPRVFAVGQFSGGDQGSGPQFEVGPSARHGTYPPGNHATIQNSQNFNGIG